MTLLAPMMLVGAAAISIPLALHFFYRARYKPLPWAPMKFLKEAIDKGIIIGPRLLVSTRAIVATGSYAPKGFAPEIRVHQGAEEADGIDALLRVVRDQIAKGADWIKFYADFLWGPLGLARPTFTLGEMKRIVEAAHSAGCKVSAHATSKEGMKRATLAGVDTIEHGDGGDIEIFRLMANKNVALCPTLAASEAMSKYRGWRKGTDPEPAALRSRRAGFKEALEGHERVHALLVDTVVEALEQISPEGRRELTELHHLR